MSSTAGMVSYLEPVALEIGIKAYEALLEEVYTTPKPGLVDLYSCGAHQDMDVHTFERSAAALRPYFVTMAAQGYNLRCRPKQLFGEIRKTGLAAEYAMYQVTGGVNTHKGLIFTMGIFCAAAGRCKRDHGVVSQAALIEMEQQMVAAALKEELQQMDQKPAASAGEKNYCRYQTRGIRGEAIDGYPAVFNLALPAMRVGIRAGQEWNSIKLRTLLVLMSQVEDSNILARHNPEVLKQVQNEAGCLLAKGGAYSLDAAEVLQAVDKDYIKRNISAGGCADLLATAIFIHKLLVWA